MDSPRPAKQEELSVHVPLGNLNSTPQRMNCIEEEELHGTDIPPPDLGGINTPQRPASLYSNQEANNSSSSFIYNQGFSFGEDSGSLGPGNANFENKRHSRYLPGPKLPPLSSTRNRSPVRVEKSSSPDRSKRRPSIILDAPFNFSSASLQPPSSAGSATSRTQFRRGHRYKHSSVSMNFFQEPEVKIPLNIVKSLPLPDLADLRSNIPWPRGYIQLTTAVAQLISCVVTFRVGHSKSWSNFVTLSHFILYDVLGSGAIILVENLSQFQVWKTGTITFPFGLNRIDVLLSFALAVSLCFMGLDLFFHVLEESIVAFVESSGHEGHDDIAPKILHSHGSHASFQTPSDEHLWFALLALNFLLSIFCLTWTFQSNAHTKYKTKNPIVTCTYIAYLTVFPLISGYSRIDQFATVLLSIFIISYGWTIAKWTSSILLMGFSPMSLKGLILNDEDEDEDEDGARSGLRHKSAGNKSHISSRVSNGSLDGKDSNASRVKVSIVKSVEEEPVFREKCLLNYDDLKIAKVSFDQYIVLLKLTIKGGSNEDELRLRLAIDKRIKRILKGAETTIEIERL
ncbi:LAMI_0A00936g1_1 [Lachancea mirantina]|uniref:LAMI_0A00936g1_1 n=1 Tax=Lachancea mirantina TaxID=1230905 RepID=A0A1G4ILG4_9SACH|nr:LAMI_0A00936g1_1 [Lachancea mirantina]